MFTLLLPFGCGANLATSPATRGGESGDAEEGDEEGDGDHDHDGHDGHDHDTDKDTGGGDTTPCIEAPFDTPFVAFPSRIEPGRIDLIVSNGAAGATAGAQQLVLDTSSVVRIDFAVPAGPTLDG